MSASLRPYQQVHAQRLREIIAARGVAHDGSDKGTGKTHIAASIIADMKVETLVICPLSVVPSWESVLADYGAKATVWNYESAWRRCGTVKPWGKGSFFEWTQKWGLFVYDECFPSDTFVRIGETEISIASVRPGMFVSTPHGLKKVLRCITKHGHHNLYRITHEGGSFECTASHRVATQRGWVRADDLQNLQDSVFRHQERHGQDVLQPEVQQCLPGAHAKTKHGYEPLSAGSKFETPTSRYGTHDEPEPDESAIRKETGPGFAYRHGPQAAGQGRQRCPADKISGIVIQIAGEAVGEGIRDRNSAFMELVPRSVLRSGEPLFENSRGMRREISQLSSPSSRRPQERENRNSAWLEVAALSERKNPEFHSPGHLGNKSRVLKVESSREVAEVYDLEVEGDHVYYADGVLVSNCHRTAGETTMQSKMMIASVRQQSKILTLSATAAHSPIKLRALGFALGLHQLSNFRDWLLSYGFVWHDIKLRSGKSFKKLFISKANQQTAMRLLSEQIFGQGNRGSRMRIADIPDFPKTQIEVRLIRAPEKSVAKLSDELRAFYAERVMRAALTTDEFARITFIRQSLETAKIPGIMDMIEDAMESTKVVVFTNYNVTIDELIKVATKNGWSFAVMRGGQPDAERAQAIMDFQANKLDVIFANIAAGSVGISLHDPVEKYPRTAIICPTFSAVDLSQATGRVARDGGGPSVQHIVYFAGTYEERVAKSVRRKLDCIDLLNDGELAGYEEDESLELKAP